MMTVEATITVRLDTVEGRRILAAGLGRKPIQMKLTLPISDLYTDDDNPRITMFVKEACVEPGIGNRAIEVFKLIGETT